MKSFLLAVAAMTLSSGATLAQPAGYCDPTHGRIVQDRSGQWIFISDCGDHGRYAPVRAPTYAEDDEYEGSAAYMRGPSNLMILNPPRGPAAIYSGEGATQVGSDGSFATTTGHTTIISRPGQPSVFCNRFGAVATCY